MYRSYFFSFCLSLFLLLSPAKKSYCLQINIQPIQVARDDGSFDFEIPISESEWDHIWSAAGIDINFLPTTQINSTKFFDLDAGFDSSSEISQLLFSGSGLGQNPDPTVVNYWFLNSWDPSPSPTGATGSTILGADGTFASGFFLNHQWLPSSPNGVALAGSHWLARYIGLTPVEIDGNIVSDFSLSFRVGTAFTEEQIAFLQDENPFVTNPVPLPTAAWMGIVLLGGLGGKQISRRKRLAA